MEGANRGILMGSYCFAAAGAAGDGAAAAAAAAALHG